MLDWCDTSFILLAIYTSFCFVCRMSAQIADQFCRHFADILQIIWYRCFTRSEADWEQICSFSIPFVEEKQIWKGFKTYPKNLETTCLCYQILEIDWSIFHFTTKTTQPHPKVFSPATVLHFWHHWLINRKILPNLVNSSWL